MNEASEKKVSVIMAVYNGERYVAQAIESVLNQTHVAFELVIVNDGSTDGTRRILDGYAAKDPRIVIIDQENAGVSAARNAGFAAATGEYFCIFDADDLMLPTKIESHVAFFMRNPSAEFVYSKVYYFFDGSYDVYRHDLIAASGQKMYRTLLRNGNFIYTSTVCFKRRVFDRFGGFDEELRSAEEFDYWLSLAAHRVAFAHEHEYLTFCRSRKDGLTSDSATMYRAAIAVLEKHIGHSIFSKLMSRQYMKAQLLLRLALARAGAKPPASAQGGETAPKRSPTSALFIALRTLKFSLTFKKVHDTTLSDFLRKADSSKTI